MTKQRRSSLRALGVCTIALLAQAGAQARELPQDKALVKIAEKLRPISDQMWNEIAGDKSSDTYDIQKGDTLWDVSQKLFGSANYWPKVWALNTKIGNPHIVNPGDKLAFTPGSSAGLPQLKPVTESAPLAEASAKNVPGTKVADNGSIGGVKEYEKIPSDKWSPEGYLKSIKTQKSYDSLGLDKDLKIELPRRFVFRVPAIANDTTLPFLGEVVASQRDGVGLSEGETVFLKSADQDLQVGTTYSVLSHPEFAREKKSDRGGYIYQATGEIRILGIRDDLYIGVISKAYDVIRRGDKLYPLLPLIDSINPIEGPSNIEALVVTSQEYSTKNLAQFRVVHFDRGIEDGVQTGQVFRIYSYSDPITGNKITDSDFLILADAIVVHATAQFSTALVIRSRDTFSRGDFGVLLTDVSDLKRQMRTRGRSRDLTNPDAEESDKELDELDELDRNTPDGLGTREEKEIKELDNWDKRKDEPGSAPAQPEATGESLDAPSAIEGSDAEPTLDSNSPVTQPDSSRPEAIHPDDAELDSGISHSQTPESAPSEAPLPVPDSQTEPALEPSVPPAPEALRNDLPSTEKLPDVDQELDTGAGGNYAPEKSGVTPVPKVEGIQPVMPEDIESPTSPGQ